MNHTALLDRTLTSRLQDLGQQLWVRLSPGERRRELRPPDVIDVGR